MKKTILAALALTLTGCASDPNMSPEEAAARNRAAAAAIYQMGQNPTYTTTICNPTSYGSAFCTTH